MLSNLYQILPDVFSVSHELFMMSNTVQFAYSNSLQNIDKHLSRAFCSESHNLKSN